MQNFHIYEEIGGGTGSVVYKGRKKQEIEFVAVKKVAKEHKQRVLNEVSVLYNFDHPNILKFINWYETRNHIWIIEEFCAGGDLFKLLSEDKRLPEWSIRTFARDIVHGLHYVHSEGFLYCDLKPSNLVLLEDGTVKLCDFGLSRPVDDDTEGEDDDEINSNGSPTRQGTPYYMAPELFHSLGTHSYASDLWSLGCLLYEMATGRTPFYSRVLNDLIPKIMTEQVSAFQHTSMAEISACVFEKVQPIPGFSEKFTDLIDGLLQKDPMQRMGWDTLGRHLWLAGGDVEGFGPLPFEDMPRQPKFEVMIKNLREQGVIQTQEVVDHTPGNTGGTRLRESLRMEAEEILRLSRIAKRNLEIQAQNEEGDEHDMAGQENSPYLKKTSSSMVLPGLKVSVSEAKTKGEKEEKGKEELNGVQEETHDVVELPVNTDVELNFNEEDEDADQKTENQHLKPEMNDEDKNRYTVPETPMHRSPERKRSFEENPNEVEDGEDDDAVVEENDIGEIMELLRHQSDATVCPLVNNNHIRRPMKRRQDTKSLPFPALTKKQLINLTKEQLDDFIEQTRKTLDEKHAASIKSQAINYLITICSDDNLQIANEMNTPTMVEALCKLVSRANVRGAALRGQSLELIGTLMRYTTDLDPDVLKTGIMEILADQLTEKDKNIKRPAAAALGELIYYVGSEETREVGVRDSLSNDSVGLWHVKPHIIKKMTRCVRIGEDEIVSHYAVQCMLNICIQSDLAWFMNMEVFSGAYSIYNKTRNKHLRAASATLVSIISTSSREMMANFTGKLGVAPIASGLQEDSSKIQQSFLNLLNFALYYQVPRLRALIRAHPTLIRSLMRLFEKLPGSRKISSSDIIIASKILCCLCMLGDLSPSFIQKCFSYNLSLSLERVIARLQLQTDEQRNIKPRSGKPDNKSRNFKEALDRLQKSLAVFQNRCRTWSIQLATDVMSAIHTQSQRRNLPTAEKKALKTLINRFPLLHDFVNSSKLREIVVDAEFVETLSSLIVTSQGTAFPGDDEFRETLLSIVEAVSQSARLLLDLNREVLSQLLPALVSLLVSNSSTIRFLSLKVLSDILIQLFRPPGESTEGEQKNVPSLCHDVIYQLLPQYKNIFKDQDTVTQKGLKLLNTLVEIDHRILLALSRYGIPTYLFEFFQQKKFNNDLHTVKLLGAVVKSSEPPDYAVLKQFCKQNLVPLLASLLKQWFKLSKEWFYHPVLEILYHILLSSARRAEVKDGNVVQINIPPATVELLHEHCSSLVEHVNLVLELMLVGNHPPKSRKPSVVQIGTHAVRKQLADFGPSSRAISRAGARNGDEDNPIDSEGALNPMTCAEVRNLASKVLMLLVEHYPKCHDSIYSQANLARLTAGLVFATKKISAGRAGKFRGDVTDVYAQRETLLKTVCSTMNGEPKRAQALVNYASKNSNFCLVLQDIVSHKTKTADANNAKYAGSILQMVSRNRVPSVRHVHSRRGSSVRNRFGY